MAAYMAQRIIDGAFTYQEVIGKRPELQAGIDSYLKEKGRIDLIQS